MKKLKLIDLRLKHFKGIETFSLQAEGENISVHGENGTGKTTLFDAFTWLLFGKDSNHKTDFEIKPLNEKGQVKQHGTNNEVEGVFLIDGKETTLKRVFSEKWVRKRGSAKEVFSGHTVTYFIDGIPKTKKEYEEFISNIIKEEIFKLITNPLYFNSVLNWKKRREILIEVSGNVTKEEIIAESNNEDLKGLFDRLEGRTIEDYKKIMESKRKELNKTLDNIPIRIDETKIMMPKVKDMNNKNIVDEIKAVQDEIELKRKKISDIKNGGEISRKRSEIMHIDVEINALSRRQTEDYNEELYRLKASIQETESNNKLLENNVTNLKEQVKQNVNYISEIENEVQALREKWKAVNNEEYVHTDECICPTCKQELPEEQIEQAREKALYNFNINKAERLEEIQKKAEHKINSLKGLQKNNEKIRSKIDTLKKEIVKNDNKILTLKDRLSEKAKDKVKDMSIQELEQKKAERENLEREIHELESETDKSLVVFKERINELIEKEKELNNTYNDIKIAEQYKKRIDELQEQEKTISREYEKISYELYLIEEYTKTKVNLLEEKINNKFEIATFKLFEEQLNGGLKETCETLYNGVPFDKGLNTAMKINVGIDIIRTLQKHYEINVPIFIDNRESVTNLLEIESQVISLVVNEKCKSLELVKNETKKLA